MLAWVQFKEDWRCFKKGERFEFRPGVNFLVGDQGVGKSTLLEQLRLMTKRSTAGESKVVLGAGEGGKRRIKLFDFEKENPRVQSAFDDELDLGTQIVVRFKSHGEVVRGMLNALSEMGPDVDCVFDEPDASLSPRSAYALAALFAAEAARGRQFIIAVHNPILIESVPEVLSLEHRRWMPAAEFLASQRVPQVPR